MVLFASDWFWDPPRFEDRDTMSGSFFFGPASSGPKSATLRGTGPVAARLTRSACFLVWDFSWLGKSLVASQCTIKEPQR